MTNTGVQPPLGTLSLARPEVDDDTFTADYWQRLVQYAEDEQADIVHYTRDEEEEPVLGEFRKLQVMSITHLLNKIARIKADIAHNRSTSSEQVTLLRQTLHQYVNAIRDYKFITELPTLPLIYAMNKRITLHGSFPELATPYNGAQNRPYDTTYRTLRGMNPQNPDKIRELLRKHLPNRLSWTKNEFRLNRESFSKGEPPVVYSQVVDWLARFIIGTMGGCALVVPMLVMTLHPSLTKSLIVVSVCVVLFALIVSLVFEIDDKDTITATATYAAVLVVFVGTSSGSG